MGKGDTRRRLRPSERGDARKSPRRTKGLKAAKKFYTKLQLEEEMTFTLFVWLE